MIVDCDHFVIKIKFKDPLVSLRKEIVHIEFKTNLDCDFMKRQDAYGSIPDIENARKARSGCIVPSAFEGTLTFEGNCLQQDKIDFISDILVEN